MKKSPIETVLGILVILVAVLFVHFAANKIDARPQRGYELTAEFSRSGGLESGNDIRISGIKVGSVTGLDLTDDYTARAWTNSCTASQSIPQSRSAARILARAFSRSRATRRGQYTSVREDGISLFGFLSRDSLDIFMQRKNEASAPSGRPW